MLGNLLRREHLLELACPWREVNEHLPLPILEELASIGSGRKITVQGQGRRIT